MEERLFYRDKNTAKILEAGRVVIYGAGTLGKALK